MSLKGSNPQNEFIGRKRKDGPFKNENFETEKQNEIEENGIVRITYKIEKNLFKSNKYITLFGKDFVINNKNKCKIIIAGKEYEIKNEVKAEEFENYDINKNNGILEVILKGKTIDDMSCMFLGCESLIKIDLSLFNTQNVTNMGDMFCDCKNLIKADLSFLNTENVKNMSKMFNCCENLVKVDLSSFNTKNVTNMENMFSNCYSLNKLDLSSFNTKNVTNMENIFCWCDSSCK